MNIGGKKSGEDDGLSVKAMLVAIGRYESLRQHCARLVSLILHLTLFIVLCERPKLLRTISAQ